MQENAEQAKRTLRPNQLEAINRLRKSIADGDRRIVLQAPTGYGKTILAAHIAESCLQKGRRLIFCAPMLTLIDQTVTRFKEQGITEIGVIQANHPMTDFSKPIQIASLQTLKNRVIPEADIVILDEGHVDYKFIEKWMGKPGWENVPFVALTATPWSRGLGLKYEKLIVASTLKELISEGTLSDFKVFAPNNPDLTDVRTVAGDFHEGDLSDAMDTPTITADIVATWLKLGQNRPTILFAVDRKHAQSLQRQFESVGVKCGYIDGQTPNEEREEVRKKFHEGEIKVVSSVNCLTTGLDWDVRCLIIGRPTKSEILHVQQIGRALRTAPGKDYALILDHAGNHSRLGFVTEIHYDELCNGEKKPKKKLEKNAPKKVVECPSCKEIQKIWRPECPSCGYKFTVVSTVITKEGELVQIDVNGTRSIVSSPLSQRTKQNWYSGLLWFAEHRNYKAGWAAVAYKDKFGEWPNGLRPIPSGNCDDIQQIIRYGQLKIEKFIRDKRKEQKSLSRQDQQKHKSA
jgi:superfamily II DNA or RNA helicase